MRPRFWHENGSRAGARTISTNGPRCRAPRRGPFSVRPAGYEVGAQICCVQAPPRGAQIEHEWLQQNWPWPQTTWLHG